MSKENGIRMLKLALREHETHDMIGFKREYLERTIAELEDSK